MFVVPPQGRNTFPDERNEERYAVGSLHSDVSLPTSRDEPDGQSEWSGITPPELLLVPGSSECMALYNTCMYMYSIYWIYTSCIYMYSAWLYCIVLFIYSPMKKKILIKIKKYMYGF